MTQERADEVMEAISGVIRALRIEGAAWAVVLVDPSGPAPAQCAGSFQDQRDTAHMLRAMANAIDAPDGKGDA